MDEAKQAILQAKYARIIEILAGKFNGDTEKAFDMFYNSATLQLMQNGIADLHCRSDRYLAEEILRESASDEAIDSQ